MATPILELISDCTGNFSLPLAIHGCSVEYCLLSLHILMSTVGQLFATSSQKYASLANLEQKNIFIIMRTTGCMVEITVGHDSH